MKGINPTVDELCRSPGLLLAFGFGSGLSPRAPGTMGTLAAIPPYLLLRELPDLAYLLLLVVTSIIGVIVCNIASRRLNVHDHNGIVWDEMVGYWLTMALAPPDWWWMVVGFVAFRFFDILKPWPIRLADKKVGGGFGIMFDDLLAGVYAFITLQFLAWITIDYTLL